jgi:hypothetical protein
VVEKECKPFREEFNNDLNNGNRVKAIPGKIF